MAAVTFPQRLLLWCTAGCALLAALACGAGAQERAEEQDVKAAFLYRFAGYVEWPASAFALAQSPLVIAVAGSDPVYERLLQMVAGRSIGGRPIAVRRLQKGEPLAGIHELFIGNGAGPWAAELRALARRRPILLVTETEGAAPPESVINFATLDNRVRFDVSLEAANANGLKLSALLLSVARQVKGRSS